MQYEQQTQKTPRKLWSADSPKQSLLESLLSVRSKWRMLVRLLPKQRSPSSKSLRSMHTIGTANSLFYIPQPSSDDESCRLERIATNSIHSKQRLNTMQIDMHRQKQNTKERGKKNPQEKLDEAHKLFNTNKCFMFTLHFKERILRACVKYHPQAREHTKQRQRQH
jgi:hypothetical protein